ncbi:hypothetical protein FEA48_14835 [Pseudomonas nitroreducens]|uniref:DUF4136 domain-containing protein n=1 Tax=Pseudomonas nitroreducens TaxID=46680 RepID=A0A5R9A6T4_PSENT|nr:hypothetical protein [Pseudomonas nitroreducens]TLP73516.1 hypothetical protein FEA48_14835 [Pseudomonas nitroreducens]
MLKKMAAGILLFMAFAALGGCVTQPHSMVQSNIADGYKANTASIYILSQIGTTQPDFNKLLETSLVKRFDVAGYKAKYVTSNGLELDTETFRKGARDFGANLILVIAPAGGTVFGGMNSFYINSKYRVSGVDLKLDKVVYRSQMAFWPYDDRLWAGTLWNDVTARKLAEDIYFEGHSKGLF